MIPLAERLRPRTLTDYVGQQHIVSEGKLLRQAVEQKQLFSMILWGPPGVGKTTLARIIAKEVNAEFLEFSAVSVGIAEIKKIVANLQQPLLAPIVFVDEIHRFNKAQQDAFLPMVESGRIILIGATTENPSFEVIGPLLSRTRVVVLHQLDHDDLTAIINRALTDPIHGLGSYHVTIKPDAIDFLIEGANGDARRVLNTLEIAVLHIASTKKGKLALAKTDIEEAMQQRALGYDKGGEEHYNTISAYIKSMRASNIDASLYYLARMVVAGEDPKFIARRMVIFASEDIGMAQPTALVIANEVFKACETIGYPECQINLAHGTVYLASAKKDRSAYDAYFAAVADVEQYGNLPIPLNLRNAPTKLMKGLGYGKGYEKYTKEDLLPKKIQGKKYYR